jgi:integrase
MTIDYTSVISDKSAYFERWEVDNMLGYCNQINDSRTYMLILTLVRTARRITEIVGEKPWTHKVGLRPCDIHWDEGLIEWDILKKKHIKSTTKTGQLRSEDTVMKERLNKMPDRKLKPVDNNYLELLSLYINSLEIKSMDRVFPISARRADQLIKKVASRVKLKPRTCKIHCHMFRHTYAIWLLKRNPNDASILRQVQELLDHSNINMTMTYAQFTQQDKQEKLNELFEE